MTTPPNDPIKTKAASRTRPIASTWVVSTVALIACVIGTASSGFGGFLLVAALFALFTATYSVVTGRSSWARIASRRVAAIVLAGSLVLTVVGANLVPRSPTKPATTSAAASRSTHAAAGGDDAAKSAVPTATPQESDAPATPIPGSDNVSDSASNTSSISATAVVLLSRIPVKGRAPMTGYARVADFGEAWIDVDHNGCDTRNDILARDLTDITKSGSCKVLSGKLVSPYTGGVIQFLRGESTSALVQIDHMVSLGDAWQTGAQQLTEAQRISLANDPLNLVAVDGKSNDQKGDGDAATWLPPNKAYRCTYVEHQVAVKATYGLWMTQAEHDAIARILAGCGNEPILKSELTPIAVKIRPKPATNTTQPKSSLPVVHPGAFCSTSGSRGVTSKGTAMVCSQKTGDPRLRWRAT